MRFDTLITGGKVVVPKVGIQDVDIAITKGKIAALCERGSGAEAGKVIDASGKHIFPGSIDPHCHWGHSGSMDAEIPGESRAAAIGGCTTIIQFPGSSGFYDRKMAPVRPGTKRDDAEPPPLSEDLGFFAMKDRVARLSYIDAAFHLAILNERILGRVDKVIRDWGISSFKFMMAYRNRPNFFNEFQDGWFYNALTTLSKYRKAVACVHAENDEVCEYFGLKVMQAGKDGLAAYAESRPDFAEAECVNRALYFGELADCPVYIVHMSAKRSLEQLARYKDKGNKAYAESCVHYLLHTVDSPIGLLGKVQPPIRTQADADGLWEGVANGLIDTLGSDNCAMRLAGKRGKTIWEGTGAFSGSGVILPLMLSEGYNKRGISLQRIAEITSYNVASIFNLYPQKGSVMVGSDADLAIVDLNLEKTMSAALMQSYCDYSIFDGWKVKGWPVMTLLRGEVIVKDGQLATTQSKGRYVPRFIVQ